MEGSDDPDLSIEDIPTDPLESIAEEERAIKRRKTDEGYVESAHRDPTHEEMAYYKETQTLFKSSLFSLQVVF
jgi:hypothetical protein